MLIGDFSYHNHLQRFQQKQYAKVKLFKTEGRGCGLLADENIKVIKWQDFQQQDQDLLLSAIGLFF